MHNLCLLNLHHPFYKTKKKKTKKRRKESKIVISRLLFDSILLNFRKCCIGIQLSTIIACTCQVYRFSDPLSYSQRVNLGTVTRSVARIIDGIGTCTFLFKCQPSPVPRSFRVTYKTVGGLSSVHMNR